ncbi:MAG: TauD/TfdA family dioxygenase [Pseudomonadales bacterium]
MKGQNHISVEPVGTAVGAEVSGIDLGEEIADAELAVLREAFARHSVLFFRDQQLTPEQHIALAERWGTINVNRFFAAVPGHPEIAEVRKEPDQTVNIGGGWHTDHSYDQIPALGSMLYARELPRHGGDTLFASMYCAYESLSSGLQTLLCGLRAVHSSRHVFGAQSGYGAATGGRIGNADAATQDAVHPVVIRHPLSGRRALYVNPAFTLRFDGWTAEESKPLLDYLYAHAARPEHAYRFRWSPGALAFWDNRATWHYAVNDYHGEQRLLHRITLEGEPLEA